jgi:hypothetical protein
LAASEVKALSGVKRALQLNWRSQTGEFSHVTQDGELRKLASPAGFIFTEPGRRFPAHLATSAASINQFCIPARTAWSSADV